MQKTPQKFIFGLLGYFLLISISYAQPVLTVNGIDSDYSKSNFYIDELQDTTFPQVILVMTPNAADVTDVEVFTNLNNRDAVTVDFDGDGIDDGILPPNGNTITTQSVGTYYQALDMVDEEDGTWTLTLPVTKTGAYRITARYKTTAGPNWNWLGDLGIRDHAVIVAPKSARDMRMYELHVANVNATSDQFADRGTFEDLHDPSQRVNMTWLREMGINWIWFQPFHPQGLDGRQTDPATNQVYDPGSPYSIRNFWEINTLYSRQYDGALLDPVSHPDNYAAAMTAFQNFAVSADTAGVELMLDFPFNHTSPDVVLGDKGIELFAPMGHDWEPSDLLRDRIPGFFSTAGGNGPAYSNPASSNTDIAEAPDRNDFGKWTDVRDVFFGRYATLVTGYPDEDTSRNTVRNESDFFDYTSLGTTTIGVWKYFGAVLPYWIEQSGHRGNNEYDENWTLEQRIEADKKGIDGLRKDFGQGLPPQAMEYIINRTHSYKWNFVFMSESLDGGEVTYRSSRHFAVLNENIIFPFKEATTSGGYRGVFEDRRSAYNQSLVLLNNLSHDEEPYADPWQALIRYAAASTNDGAPMIMYGQEIGAAQKAQDALPQGSWDWYELNFAKDIPNFKKWNSMQPQWTAWDNNDLGVQFLRPVYAGIGQAREFSPALRSNDRWFLYPQSGGDKAEIFSVVKHTGDQTPLGGEDVVMAFVNLDRTNVQAETFAIPVALADRIGLQDAREYNVKNIAAYVGRSGELAGRRDTWLWPSNRSRGDILTNGVYVSMNPVPSTDAAWVTAPYEAQYLKVYDVTAPTAAPEQPDNPEPFAYALGDSAVFDWPDVSADAGGVTPHYEVTIVVDDGTPVKVVVSDSLYVYEGAVGEEVRITVKAVNPDEPANAGPASIISETIKLLDPAADEDSDNQSNSDEANSGTDPRDGASAFKVINPTMSGDDVSFTIQVVHGYRYTVQSRLDLVNLPDWANEDEANAVMYEPSISETDYSYTDLAPSLLPKFYRVLVQPALDL